MRKISSAERQERPADCNEEETKKKINAKYERELNSRRALLAR